MTIVSLNILPQPCYLDLPEPNVFDFLRFMVLIELTIVCDWSSYPVAHPKTSWRPTSGYHQRERGHWNHLVGSVLFLSARLKQLICRLVLIVQLSHLGVDVMQSSDPCHRVCVLFPFHELCFHCARSSESLQFKQEGAWEASHNHWHTKFTACAQNS